MCFENDSLPPASEAPGHRAMPAAASRQILTSPDGASFAAFLAKPESASRAGIVVLPDMRGLFGFYEQLALRLAEQGHTALAIDYFGRTAGVEPRGPNFPFMEHIVRVTRQGIATDIATAGEFLRSAEGGACPSVLALGFCFGGRQAFFASAARFGFAGGIGFYGAVGGYPNGAPGPLQHASELSASILGLFGGADHGIPPADIAAFDEALGRAGVEHEFVTYPHAPHSFFDVKYAEHAEACQDAWRRVLEFIRRRTSD